jgi:hypothetical protein
MHFFSFFSPYMSRFKKSVQHDSAWVIIHKTTMRRSGFNAIYVSNWIILLSIHCARCPGLNRPSKCVLSEGVGSVNHILQECALSTGFNILLIYRLILCNFGLSASSSNINRELRVDNNKNLLLYRVHEYIHCIDLQ